MKDQIEGCLKPFCMGEVDFQFPVELRCVKRLDIVDCSQSVSVLVELR